MADPSQTASVRGSQLGAYNILQTGPNAQRHLSDSPATASCQGALSGGRGADHPQTIQTNAYSSSSRNAQISATTHTETRDVQRDVRTLPPWIDSFEEEEDALIRAKPTDKLLSSPSQAHSAQHHYAPTNLVRRMSQDGFVTYDDVAVGGNEKRPDTGFFSGHREPGKGRKWDHARQGDPVIMQSGFASPSSPWHNYIKSSMYGPEMSEDAKRVNDAFLLQQTPGYEKPWRGDMEANNDSEKLSGLLLQKKSRRTLIKRVQQILLTHPLVPLVFRVIVLTTSIIALGLSTSVHHLCNKYSYPQNPSTTMAIAVDVVAIPYILYITWDEYTGKPLGLRSPKAKIRLVLLDLFFIVFESANLSLAFAALTDESGACETGGNGANSGICGRVKTLCGILLVALIAWSQTFTVSIFRLVERVGGRDEGD